MRTILLACTALAATSAVAAENKIAALGLKDGFYCRVGGTGSTGDDILVSATGSRPFIGIDGLDCHDPVVSGGRLTAGACYANGGRAVPISKTYAAGADRITLDGADYLLTPVAPGQEACAAAPKSPVTRVQAANPISKFGVKEGDYCSKDGLRIAVGSSSVYMMMVDCQNPKIANGKISSNTCTSTGGFPVSFDATFQASGDTIVSNGRTYTLTPERPGKLPCELPAEAASAKSAADDSDEPAPFMSAGHNGSEMELTDTRILYSRPKASIRDVVKPGTVLVEGRWNGERFEGTAFAFKKGCAPAPYAVSGAKVEKPGRLDLVLHGAGPIRKGCEVVGYSEKSPHARLVFDQIMSN